MRYLRFLFVTLILSACAERIPDAPVGSGVVWTKEGPVLSDRRTGAVQQLSAELVPSGARYTPPTTSNYGATGLSVGDIDNDGVEEIFLNAEWGEPRLLKRAGSSFIDITQLAGITPAAGFKSSFASAFVDIDGDGDKDLYVAQSASFATIAHACEKARKKECVAQEVVGPFPNLLFLNDGAGKFTEAPNARGANNLGATLALTFADLDNDGDVDLFLANDFGPDAIYQNNNGYFTDVTEQSGAHSTGGGMGVAAGDLNNDGLPDLYVTHYGHDTVLINHGNMKFSDESEAWGVNAYSLGTIGWGVMLHDFDDDGRLDVAVARGWWDPDHPIPASFAEQAAYTIARNRNNRFTLAAEGTRGAGAWGIAVSEHGVLIVASPYEAPRFVHIGK